MQNIAPLIKLFQPLNELESNYRKLFSNVTERKALESIVNDIGYEKTEKILKELPLLIEKDNFAGKGYITKPTELARKFDKVCELKKRILKQVVEAKQETRKYKEVVYKPTSEIGRLANLKRMKDYKDSNPFGVSQNEPIKEVKPKNWAEDRKCIICGEKLTYQADVCDGTCMQERDNK